MTTQLLDKFFRGECDDKELSEVLLWINSGKINNEVADLMGEYFESSEKDVTSIVDQEKLNFIKNKLNADIIRNIDVKTQEKPKLILSHSRKSSDKFKQHIKTSLKIAASLSLFLAGIFLLQRNLSPSEKVAEQTFESQWVSRSTNNHQISRIWLQDGTIVTLNKSSQLWIDRNYADSNRKVYLSGEAFFEVKSNPMNPFIVYCQDMEVTVTGTSFNIRESEGEPTQVALVSGKIDVVLKNPVAEQEDAGLSNGNPITLSPGQTLVVSGKSEGQYRITDFNYFDLVGWKDGVLYFKDADFQHVIRKLEHWYNVQIAVTGAPSKSWRYSGQFKDETLKNILEGLTYTSNFKYSISGNKVTISF